MRSYIKETTEKLIKKYKTRNPFELANSMNIIIKYYEFKNLKGFYKYHKRNRYIILNQNLNTIMKSLCCAHEIGHDQLHRHHIKLMKDYNLFSTSKLEYEANTMAAHILVSDNLLNKYQNTNYTIEQIAVNENLYPDLIRLKFGLFFRI